MFCMFYALAGIPLGLVMFQSIGERLNTFVAFVLRHVKRCMGVAQPQVTHINLIVVASACGSLVMAAGAFVFHRTEGWVRLVYRWFDQKDVTFFLLPGTLRCALLRFHYADDNR